MYRSDTTFDSGTCEALTCHSCVVGWIDFENDRLRTEQLALEVIYAERYNGKTTCIPCPQCKQLLLVRGLHISRRLRDVMHHIFRNRWELNANLETEARTKMGKVIEEYDKGIQRAALGEREEHE